MMCIITNILYNDNIYTRGWNFYFLYFIYNDIIKSIYFIEL